MGMFDDLIPAAPAPSAQSGMFDDLIPAQPSTAPARGSRAAAEMQAPDRGWLQWAADNLRAGAALTGRVPFRRSDVDRARAIGQGVTLSFGDEIEAGARAAGNYVARKAGADIPERGYRDIKNEIAGEQRDFTEQNPGTALGLEVGGSLLPGVGSTNLLLRAVPWLSRAPSVARAAIAGGASSAPMGAVTAVGKAEGPQSAADYAQAAGEGALTSGLLGAGVAGAGHAVGSVVRPWVTAAARQLHDRGIRLTPGELMGGYAKRLEDSTTAAPFIGHLVRSRQAEGIESLNRAAWDEALAPMGRRYALPRNTEMGHEAVREATDLFNRRYGAVVPRMTAQMDPQLTRDIAQISQSLPQSVRPQFADAYRRHVEHVLDPQSGIIDGRGLQHTLGALRDEARRLQTSQSSHAYDHDLGSALNEMRDKIVESARRYTPKRTMTSFDNIQRAYRNFVVLRDASSRTGAEQGVFNPTQMHAAVRAADRSAGKGATARGEAALQEISGPAKAVMTRRVADSGTPERAALLGAILNPGLAAKGLAMGLGPAALYTRAGNALFRAGATSAPVTREALGTAIQNVSPYAAPVTAQELNRLLQE